MIVFNAHFGMQDVLQGDASSTSMCRSASASMPRKAP